MSRGDRQPWNRRAFQMLAREQQAEFGGGGDIALLRGAGIILLRQREIGIDRAAKPIGLANQELGMCVTLDRGLDRLCESCTRL